MIITKHKLEENIISIIQSDICGFKEAIQLLSLLEENYGHLDVAYILEDSRNSTFDFKLGELPSLLGEVRKRTAGFKEVRHADLVSSPLNTALSFIYGRMASQIPNYTYRVFSTEKAAIQWIKDGAYYKP